MYDTIDIKLDIQYLNPNNKYTLEEIRDNLGGIWTIKAKSPKNQSGITYQRYYRDNYKAELNQFGLYLYGSLCKFYFGNNYQTLTRANIKEALDILRFEVNAPLEKAVIKRIHFAYSVEVDHPVILYQNSFDFKRKRSISWRKNTLYYERSKWALAFYDKYKELKRNYLVTDDIPKNLFRYELRLEKPKYFFKGAEVLLSDLYKNETYNYCLMLWVKNLLGVYSGLKLGSALKDYSDIVGLRKQAFLIFIESMGGLAEVLDDINMRRKLKIIQSAKKHEYCRKAVLNAFKSKKEYEQGVNIKDRLVKEVKRKLIQGAFAHSRR